MIGITEFHTDPGARDSARQEVVEARSVERIAQDEIHEDEEALCTTQSQVGKMNREEAMAEVGMNRSLDRELDFITGEITTAHRGHERHGWTHAKR